MSTAAAHKRRHFDVRAFLFFEGITLLVGMLGGLLGGIDGFAGLHKPPLTPPSWVFPAVWTALYILMGIAAYLVWNSDDIDRAAPLRLYLYQLVLNGLWPLVFFRLQWRLAAFFLILVIIGLVTLVMAGFRPISKAAYRLMLPYLLWLLFAAYLNLAFYLLNR